VNVIAIGAHPDDIEFYCSGTLARCAARGDNVFFCVVANGDKGGYGISPEELAAIRAEEAKRAAAVIGATLIHIGLPDLGIHVCDEHLNLIVDAIRQAKADLIITHCPDEYMRDHKNTSELVYQASFMVGIPNWETKVPYYKGMPPVYYMEPPGGMGFIPTEYVDVTDVWDKKRAMLSCHKSQVSWLKEHDNMDMLDSMEVMGRYRGEQCGVRYAEGFRQMALWPRMRTERLLP
jgi:LmbE family N-acetylglucosaminyl deacetylase